MVGVVTKKYTYILEEASPLDKEVFGGCYGCFFVKVRNGYLYRTCGKYPESLTRNCFAKGIIYKLVSRKLRDPKSLKGNKGPTHY